MCATLINHGERLIMPSSHYMHSLINAVNELPLLTYDATTVWPRTYIRCRPTPSRGDGVGVRRPRGPGCCRWHGGTSQNGTLHMRQNSGGGVRVRARARVGVWVCVRARDSVCYNIRFSLSPILQLLILGQALGFALWKTGVRMIKEKKWVALVTNGGDIFQEENQDDKICNSMLPWFCFFIIFSPHRREYCNEKPKAKYCVGRLNFPWTCWTSKTCLLSSAEAAQPWQYTGIYSVPHRKQGKLTLLHHLVLVSSNKPGQTACQQHPNQLFRTRIKVE